MQASYRLYMANTKYHRALSCGALYLVLGPKVRPVWVSRGEVASDGTRVTLSEHLSVRYRAVRTGSCTYAKKHSVQPSMCNFSAPP